MWNKNLLRTKRTASGSGNVVQWTATKPLVIMLLMVIVLIGGVAEARYYNGAAAAVKNNELIESATAMIEFRNSLQRIVQDSSLTLLQAAAEDTVPQQVRGLRFNAVQHPLLCDGDLSDESRLNVQIVTKVNYPEEEQGQKASFTTPAGAVNYLCAVWPVSADKEGTSANQLEWLSANGIEHRSAVGSDGGDETDVLVMHLGKRAVDLKRYEFSLLLFSDHCDSRWFMNEWSWSWTFLLVVRCSNVNAAVAVRR